MKYDVVNAHCQRLICLRTGMKQPEKTKNKAFRNDLLMKRKKQALKSSGP